MYYPNTSMVKTGLIWFEWHLIRDTVANEKQVKCGQQYNKYGVFCLLSRELLINQLVVGYYWSLNSGVDFIMTGRDNYPANLVDNAFGEVAYRYDADVKKKPKPLNVGYYHQ